MFGVAPCDEIYRSGSSRHTAEQMVLQRQVLSTEREGWGGGGNVWTLVSRRRQLRRRNPTPPSAIPNREDTATLRPFSSTFCGSDQHCYKHKYFSRSICRQKQRPFLHSTDFQPVVYAARGGGGGGHRKMLASGM